jgi:hypothetical protein
MTDPQTWASDRPMQPSRGGGHGARWSPPPLPGISPRTVDPHPRLPSLADFPHRTAASHWDGSGGGSSYPILNTRPTSAYTDRPPSGTFTDSRPGSGYPGPEQQHRPPTARINPPPQPAGFAEDSLPHSPPSASRRESVSHDSPGGTGKHTVNSPSDDAPQKKKKRRVALSCAECAKRKQKCNRETPCQHCVARRVPELCVPYTRTGSPPPRNSRADSTQTPDAKPAMTAEVPASGPRPPSMLPTLSVRVARLEAMVNSMINRVGEPGLEGKALSDWRISTYGFVIRPLTADHAQATTPPPQSHESPREGSADWSSRSRQRTAGDADELSAGNPETVEQAVLNLDVESSTRNPRPQSVSST